MEILDSLSLWWLLATEDLLELCLDVCSVPAALNGRVIRNSLRSLTSSSLIFSEPSPHSRLDDHAGEEGSWKTFSLVNTNRDTWNRKKTQCWNSALGRICLVAPHLFHYFLRVCPAEWSVLCSHHCPIHPRGHGGSGGDGTVDLAAVVSLNG